MKKLILPMTLLFIFLLSCTAFASDNWHKVVSTNYTTIYIDDDSIKYGDTWGNSDDSSATTTSTSTSSSTSTTTAVAESTTTSDAETVDTNIINYYQTEKFSKEGLPYFIANMQKKYNQLAAWDQVSYVVTFNSINVKNKTSKTVTQWFYDSNNKLLYTWHANKNTSWKEIKPSTVIEESYKYIITYANGHESQLGSRQ